MTQLEDDGKSAEVQDGSRQGRCRLCLLKGCERPFHPPHPLSRYCSAECEAAARPWRQRTATSLLNGRSFRSLEHLNEVARWWLLELASGEFVRRRENLVFVGKSGVGKSHLIQGIGRCCCVLGYGVRYTTSAELLEELTAAAGEKNLPARVRYYGRFDLLIIDEFGFDKLERLEYPESPSLLYKVIDHRSRRGSTALVTNLDFQGWSDYLGDPPLAMALLDRVVDGAIIQRMDGKSYREYRAEQKKAGTRQSKTRQPGKS